MQSLVNFSYALQIILQSNNIPLNLLGGSILLGKFLSNLESFQTLNTGKFPSYWKVFKLAVKLPDYLENVQLQVFRISKSYQSA